MKKVARYTLYSLLVLGLGAMLYFWSCLPVASKAVCRASVPEPRLIAVQLDFTPAEQAADSCLWRLVHAVDSWKAWGWEGRFSQGRREHWEGRLKDLSAWQVSDRSVMRIGYWKGPVGQSRFGGRPVLGADVVYTVFLELSSPLSEGESVVVTTPFGQELSVSWNATTVSPFIKVNQAGYAVSAPKRYAYLGGWLGTGGPWHPPLEASHYEVCEVATGRPVVDGEAAPRPADGVTDGGTPWTGEDTYELDLSARLPAGRYFIRIPGVGRSLDFDISDDGPARALACHLHGLFAQRCGSEEKTAPRTAWGDAACHLKVWRGTFPPDAADYSSGRFVDAAGAPVSVEAFDVIERNTDWSAAPESFPGGWHDAADYDRRPYHLRIVNDLAAIRLAKGDRVPAAVLEEAAWGLEHLRRAQTEDGAVGTWIETVRHPVEGEGLPSADALHYALSRPTRASTLAYAAAAAHLARCSPALRDRYLDSALRAWRWVQGHAPETHVPFVVAAGSGEKTVFWSESPDLPARDLAKAAINLTALTGDASYLDAVLTEAFLKRFDTEFGREANSWSPLVLLEVYGDGDGRLEPYRTRMTRWLTQGADRCLAAQAVQPYRLPRQNGSNLAWGAAHPLVAARWLVAAAIATGREDYRAGAFLANDYHCGCNPDGMTLTSGLGSVYPVRFLSLQSVADGVPEYVAGITPYRWTYGVGENDYRAVHSAEEVDAWPIWRRRPAIEALHVPSGEYTVWETIGPAAAVTAWLVAEGEPVAELPSPPVPQGRPEDLPGYWALP